MNSNASRKETERTKLIQEKCQTLLTQMLRDEDNKYCVDCDAKGPRWASWNLGVFLCIRCAGIHRNLGVHISRVKSVNLDTWTPEQVISLQQMGNSRARAVYEAQLPDGFRRPQTDNALESFIRAKYEHKKYLAREWVQPSPPKIDWAKEIDDELERQKRKKKAAQASNALGLGTMSSVGSVGSGGGERKASGGSTVRTATALPAPLPKPKPGQSGSSPKSHRPGTATPISCANNNNNADLQTNDLLGLSTPTKPVVSSDVCSGAGNCAPDFQNDSFSGFLSAPLHTDTASDDASKAAQHIMLQNSATAASFNPILVKEEQDFFKQGTLPDDKDKSSKLTKDSILALYSAAPPNPHKQTLSYGQPQHQQQQAVVQQQQQLFAQNAYIPHNSINFTGMSPGFMGGAGTPAQQQPQHHPQQFMAPPNSASMYNAPVMTAPTAFSTPGIGAGVPLGGSAGLRAGVYGSPYSIYAAPMQPIGMMTQHMMALSGGIMATGQTTSAAAANASQLLQSNQSRFLGNMMGGGGGVAGMLGGVGGMLSGAGGTLGVGAGMPMIGAAGGLPSFPAPVPPRGAATAASTNANLNQQFGNLNIGNVWQ